MQEDVSATLATSQDQTLFALSTANTKANGSNCSTDGASYTLDLANSNAVPIQGSMVGMAHENGPQGCGYEDDDACFTLNCADRHAVAFAQNSRDEVRYQGDGTLSGALAADEGMKQRTYVAQPIAFKYHQGSSAWSIGAAEGMSTTPDTAKPPVVCMASDAANAAVDVDMSGTLHVGGSAPMVSCMSDTQAHASVDEECCGTLTSRMFKDAPVVGQMVVRRLTPTECERLQGFPDGYTDIHLKCTRTKDGGYRVAEVDETPDTPRYKALGNSMAVPCMRLIGERIQQREQRRTA